MDKHAQRMAKTIRDAAAKFPVAMIVLHVDGTVRVLENGGYRSIRKAVGGLLDVAGTKHGGLLFLHDEGRLLELTPNWLATKLLEDVYGGEFPPLVGTCVLTGPARDTPDGETAYGPLPSELIDRVGVLASWLAPRLEVVVFDLEGGSP